MAEEKIGNFEKFAGFFELYGGRVIAITDFEYNESPYPHVTRFEIWSELAGVSFLGFGVSGVGLVPAFFSTFTGTFEVEGNKITLRDPEAPYYKSVSFNIKGE